MPLVQFAYNNSHHSTIGMAPYEALYHRKCRTPLCWSDMGDKGILGPELVRETTDKIQKIRQQIKVAQIRQKSYADNRWRPLEFEEGDHVFLRVTPTIGIGRAIQAKKLSPRLIRPFQILQRVGPISYKLGLLSSLSSLHDVFNVSHLKKYIPDLC